MNAPSPIRILWFVNGFNTLFLSFDSSSLLHESILRSYLYFLNSIYRVSLTYTSYHDSWDWDLICRIPYSFIYTKWNHIFKWVQNWHTSNRNIRSSYNLPICLTFKRSYLPNLYWIHFLLRSNLLYHPSDPLSFRLIRAWREEFEMVSPVILTILRVWIKIIGSILRNHLHGWSSCRMNWTILLWDYSE